MEKYKNEQKLEKYKVCRRCFDPKPIGDFKPREGGKKTSYCKVCIREYQHEHHIKNRDKDREKKSHRVARNRSIILKHLESHPCVDCGENDLLVLEMDHVRGNKIGDVIRMASNGVGEEALATEIAKCDTRCANCHRRKTVLSTPNHWRVRALSQVTGNI